jgi:hypothetical protein
MIRKDSSIIYLDTVHIERDLLGRRAHEPLDRRKILLLQVALAAFFRTRHSCSFPQQDIFLSAYLRLPR